MTGRGQVVVLWDPEHPPPPGPLLDAAALATTGWDWSYCGPTTPVRPPTMATVHGTEADEILERLASADVIVGVPTMWTLGHVVSADARFIAVVLGPIPDHDVEVHEVVVEGWPAASLWSGVLDGAMALDDAHRRTINEPPAAVGVADDIRTLLTEIRTRYLPSSFRRSPDGDEHPADA